MTSDRSRPHPFPRRTPNSGTELEAGHERPGDKPRGSRLPALCSLAVIIALGLFAARPAHAQDDKGPPPRILRFYYLNYASADSILVDPVANFLYQNGKDTASLRLAANSLSAPVLYQGPLPVVLFKNVTDSSGVVTPRPLGRLSFPDDWPGALFLVTPETDAGAALPFRFYPIEYGGPGLAAKHARVLNLCAGTLTVKLGSVQRMIPSGGQDDLDISGVGGTMVAQLALQHGGQWNMVMSTLLPTPPRRRMLLVVMPGSPARNDTARTVMIQDLPE